MRTTITHFWRIISLFVLLGFTLVGCGAQSSNNNPTGPVTLHLGYFPNLTHAVALVGVARGTFQSALGSNVKIEPVIFNAGPAEITALYGNQVDIGYIGSGPAINGYVKSHDQALRVLAGAASGGALLVVRSDEHIQTAKDLSGKKIASPQLGGTQDIALRYYLQQHGLQPADKGGTVQILPTDNPTILTLFEGGKIDGAWVPEPWATRLVVEGHGKIFVDERTLWPDGKFVTTDVIVRKAFLDQYPDIVNKFLQAHVDTVQWILSNPESAKTIVNSEIKRITGKALSSTEINLAYQNMDITYDPLTATFQEAADHAYSLGFLGTSKPDLNGIFYLGPLNQALSSKGLATVAGP